MSKTKKSKKTEKKIEKKLTLKTLQAQFEVHQANTEEHLYALEDEINELKSRITELEYAQEIIKEEAAESPRSWDERAHEADLCGSDCEFCTAEEDFCVCDGEDKCSFHAILEAAEKTREEGYIPNPDYNPEDFIPDPYSDPECPPGCEDCASEAEEEEQVFGENGDCTEDCRICAEEALGDLNRSVCTGLDCEVCADWDIEIEEADLVEEKPEEPVSFSQVMRIIDQETNDKATRRALFEEWSKKFDARKRDDAKVSK